MSCSPTTLNEALDYLRNIINSHGNKKILITDHKENFHKIITILEDIESSDNNNPEEKEQFRALYSKQQKELKSLSEQNKDLNTLANQQQIEIEQLKSEITKIKAQKYDEISNKKYESNNMIPTTSTFAQAVKNNRAIINNTIQRKDHVVIITPKEDNLSKDSNQTIAILKEKIDTKTTLDNGLRIERFQPARGKKCLIKCNSEQDVEKICNILNNDDKIIAKKPTKKNPRVMIVGISKDILGQEILDLIKAQNPNINEFLLQNHNEFMKIIFDKPDRVGTKFAIVETSPALWKIIIDGKRLFIGHKACPVRNRVSVLQCFNCQRFGHSANNCQNKTVCGNCAGEHKTESCKQSISKCTNCDRANNLKRTTDHPTENLNTNHRAYNTRCPQYQKEIAAATKYYHYG